MKKSKILVPALGILALSTAAAVSGTVAWFSASRSVDFAVSSTVINPEGALKVTLAAGPATQVNAEGTAVSLKDNIALRDASVDIGTTLKSPVVYRAHLDGSGEHATSFDVCPDALTTKASTTSSKTPDSKTFDVWYVATWTATFSMPDSPTTESFDIYFDEAESSYGVDVSAAVQNAYRVGMYSPQSTAASVWAPKHTVDSTFTASYVDADTTVVIGENTSTTPATKTYTLTNNGNYTCCKGTVTDSVTAAVAHADNKYLGTITGGSGNLTVTFISWFEGTDPDCITTSNFAAGAYSVASGTMSFNVLPADAYATA
ncbi:MAG: hypothetical protein MJ236_04195 [Clostridia bacterium]|nr:hypothetical protein [Clostridia bacterium]